MHLLFKVGRYEGEVRGPVPIETARHLIATGQAVQAVFDPESETFIAPQVQKVQTSETPQVSQQHKKARR
ncbi:MAG: hypothetical protein ACJ71W_22055 [Terriglobales bacterium]